MSDEAVKAKTGKDWAAWFKILDQAGARKMGHQEIVAVLSDKHGVGPWWQQMVTVTYEKARGLRAKHEKPAGYEISVSRTIAAPVNKIYHAWQDEKERAKWLPEPGTPATKLPIVVRTASRLTFMSVGSFFRGLFCERRDRAGNVSRRPTAHASGARRPESSPRAIAASPQQ